MTTNSSIAATSHKVVRIGVFIPYPAQLLDVASIDILASMSREYFAMVGDMVPPAIFEVSSNVEIFCECWPKVQRLFLLNPVQSTNLPSGRDQRGQRRLTKKDIKQTSAKSSPGTQSP